jgi:subtilisin family serine protease
MKIIHYRKIFGSGGKVSEGVPKFCFGLLHHRLQFNYYQIFQLLLIVGLVAGLEQLSQPALAQSPPEVTNVEAALADEQMVRVIVALHPLEAGAAQAEQIAQSQESVAHALAPADFNVVQQFQNLPGLVGEVTPAGLAALRQQPEVAAIALDLPVEAADFSASAIFIHADAVQRDFGLSGAGVNVAVLDTGVDTAHVDLASSLISQHCFNRNGGCPPVNGVEGDSAQDENGHGTHVAGIIAGRGQTSPQGIAAETNLVAVRVLGRSGTGFTSDVLAGMDWVVAHQAQLNVKVMNLSLGGGSYNGVCDQADANTMLYAAAVQAARQAGMTIFAAAGNGGQAEALMAPACVLGVVAVGNVYDTSLSRLTWPTCVDENIVADQVACSSNSSSELDLLAPGVQIRSTGLGGGEGFKSGTSMSTPHAAAVAALLIQANPALTADEVETILEETGVLVTDGRNGRVTPRIDALAAVTRVVVGQVTQISGTVLLQGRMNHGGTQIFLSEQPCNSAITAEPAAITDAEGNFEINVPADQTNQCLEVRQTGYLTGQKNLPQGDVGTLTLPGGDVVKDEVINILDLALMAIHYGSTEARADVNADGEVDIFDLTIAASNYNARGPVSNWE